MIKVRVDTIQDYVDLADELTDEDCADRDQSWFDPTFWEAAKAQAAEFELPFPPGIGDLDRLYQGELGVKISS